MMYMYGFALRIRVPHFYPKTSVWSAHKLDMANQSETKLVNSIVPSQGQYCKASSESFDQTNFDFYWIRCAQKMPFRMPLDRSLKPLHTGDCLNTQSAP
jgi:hypothetical protein